MATETTNEVAEVTQDTVEEMNQFVQYIQDLSLLMKNRVKKVVIMQLLKDV